MDKKNFERKVFDETLVLAWRRGGESRRNADKLAGAVTQSERPDFVIESGLSKVIAVEHFRADFLSELNLRSGHQDSLAAAARNHASKIQKKWDTSSFDLSIPQEVADAVGESMAKCLEARSKASYRGYIKSFSDGLCAHVDKLGAYRENVREQFGDSRAIETAFLVELHSDFSDCFAHNGSSCFKPKPGELILFDDMIDLIKSTTKNLDYIMFGSYEALKDNLIDAAVIRPTLLETSLKRNKLPVFRYLGENKDRDIYGPTRIKASATIAGDQIDLEFERSSQEMSIADHIRACVECLPQVINAYRCKQSFITTATMQLFLELCEDALPENRRISCMDIESALSALGDEEIERRISKFDDRWYPDQKQ